MTVKDKEKGTSEDIKYTVIEGRVQPAFDNSGIAAGLATRSGRMIRTPR